jgi:hypothetical protein
MGTGSCRCGAVAFDITEDMGDVRLCYCATCRKIGGSAFSAVALVDAAQFRLTRGQDNLSMYESIPGKYRYHCKTCHAPIYVRLESAPQNVRIRLGLLDFEPTVRITAHIWVSEKPDWYEIRDDLPQLAEF